MKSIFLLVFIISLTWIAVFTSCRKELSCYDCSNKSPIAIVGPDQTILLPKDSTMLDGSASTDPDGTITSYKWQKLRVLFHQTLQNLIHQKR